MILGALPSIRFALRWAFGMLHEVATPRLDAELLLAHVLSVPRVRLFVQDEEPLTSEQWLRFQELVQKRIQHVPVAYLTGVKEFYGLLLEVNDRVLIPRPDTECLVEAALDKLNLCREPDAPWVVDVGTGSGAIALALKQNFPKANVLGVDRSQGALQMAKKNADRLGISVQWLRGDGLQALPEKRCLDVVVSNPPYIPSAAVFQLPLEVQQEPHSALDGGTDGFFWIQRFAEQAFARLREDGWFLVEVGDAQAPPVAQFLQSVGYTNLHVYTDGTHRERVVAGLRAKRPKEVEI